MSRYVNKVFLLDKKCTGIMMELSPRNTCRLLFKTLRTMTVPSQYILSLIKFLFNNFEYLSCNNTIHTKFTRNGL